MRRWLVAVLRRGHCLVEQPVELVGRCGRGV